MDPSDEHVTEVELSPVGSPPSKPGGHRHGAMAVAALVAGAVLISGASGGGHALSTSELADFAGPELPEDNDRDSGRRRVIRWEEYGPDEPAERDPIETFDSDEMAIEIDPYEITTSTLDPLLVDPWVPPEYDDTFPPVDTDWDGPTYTVPPRRTTPPRATVPPRRTTTTTSTTTSTSSTTSTSTTTTTIVPGTGTTSSSSTTTSSIVPPPPGQTTTTTTMPPFCHLTTTTTSTTLPLGITIPPVVLPDWMTTTTPPCVTTTTTTTTTTTPP